jgi:hypothetical protein
MIDSGLAIGGVDKHVRVAGVGQRPVPKGGHLDVQIGADPRHLRFGDARVDPKGLHHVVDLAGRHPVQISLHDHREQRLINPTTAFQQ